MSYIIEVHDHETGSSTSIWADTRVGALLAAIDWLGGTIAWFEEGEDTE